MRTDYDNQTIAAIMASRERPQYLLMALLAAVMAQGVRFLHE